jgi:hypothetical protein
MGMFAGHTPGFHDDPLLLDSTPLECARSRETAKRSALGDAADYGSCPSRSRHSWGFRLHAIFAPDGTPRAPALRSPKADEREVGLALLDRCQRHGGEILLGEEGYASRAFATAVSQRDATFVRAPQNTKPGGGRISRRSARDRIDLLDLQRPPHPRTPRRPHPRRTPRTDPRPILLPRRRDHPNHQPGRNSSSTTAPNRAESTI